MMILVMESPTLRFAATARILTEAARRSGNCAPTFRSPPRVKGRMRTIRRHANGGATVSLVLRDRPWSAVVADMIEGFVVVNDVDPVAAERLRDLLWASLDEIDLHVGQPSEASVTDLATVSEPALHIVDAA
jgi:hypothetical protein